MEKTFVQVTSLTSIIFSIGFFATNSAIALPHVFPFSTFISINRQSPILLQMTKPSKYLQ